MRRALGLRDAPLSRPEPSAQIPSSIGAHRTPRRFVRDGEVPVSVIHRDEPAGTNQLDQARQVIRSLTAAREHAERLLSEAQNTIRDLQTKLAHERMAKDEAVQRAEADRLASQQALQATQEELSEERANRRQAEHRLAESQERCREVEQRLRDAVARQGRQRDAAPLRTEQPPPVARTPAQQPTLTGISELPEGEAPPKRRRGRPPKVREPEPETEFVEWWKPGWKNKLR